MPVFLCRALSREPVNCDPWAGWDPLPSPDSSRRHIANGAQAEILEEPTNGLHNTGMHFSLLCQRALTYPNLPLLYGTLSSLPTAQGGTQPVERRQKSWRSP